MNKKVLTTFFEGVMWGAIILLLCGVTKKCTAQNFKSYLPSITCVFLSGATDGLRDASMYRMDGKGAFWNGKQSWLNKYKNRDIKQGAAYFGSTSFLVWTTDAAHLSNMFTHQFDGMALAFAPEDKNKRFFHVFLKVAAYNAIRGISHAIVYDVIFKPQGRD